MELPDRYWDTEQQRWIYPGDLPPLPEPKFPINSATRWSDEEMRSYGESCARMAREEAARIAEDTEAGDGSHDYNAGAATMSERIAAAIRKG